MRPLLCVTAERDFLRAQGGGCHVAIAARAVIEDGKLIPSHISTFMKSGICYLVGAGPGDPGLLTIKGRSSLERAEVVVYDYLCNPALLKWARIRRENLCRKEGGRTYPFAGGDQRSAHQEDAGRQDCRAA
jgi:porphobilinogen deaminase